MIYWFEMDSKESSALLYTDPVGKGIFMNM